MTLRWLHISDIHECECEGAHRRKMYESIVEAVKKHDEPDFVFLTGDCAFAGKGDEYENLIREFIEPLKQALPDKCRLFTVPGNHDADRSRSMKPRLWSGDPDERKSFNATDAKGRQKRADALGPRFSSYADFDTKVADWGASWIDSEAGAVSWSGEVNDANVAVVGVNTAWFAQDDDDWGKLTPGRDILDNILDAANKTDPDLLIVLGHHPLAAMMGDDPDSDGLRIKDRLEQANALYLHGHMHVSGTDKIGNALRTALTIQAPSAFQVHDSKRWRNGLMWGEVDLEKGQLFIEPLLWNEDKREYKFDVDAGYNDDRVPGVDKYHLPLPTKGGKEMDAPNVNKGLKPDLPHGWQVVDSEKLAQLSAKEPDVATMTAYFDGSIPKWNLVRARGMKSRKIVDELVRRLRDVYGAPPRPASVLLIGAGGEGKSTALLQAAATLIDDAEQQWTCLHRTAFAANVPSDLFGRLEYKDNHAWVVVIDDADNVGLQLIEALKHIAPRTDVHLLLAARDADWQIKGIVPGHWGECADFRQVHLQGLDDEDAARIVGSWSAWGAAAMGELRGQSEENATAALVTHARENAARPGEGALLGALLITRIGEDMRAHVRGFVDGLGTEVFFGKYTLRDVYTMIAAMHAENQLYLSRSVLAYALGCDLQTLERDVLRILRREAMLDTGDIYVLTRHRRIAEAACAVLREDGYDVDQWYPVLARAALLDSTKNRTWNPDIGHWRFDLANHFVEKDEIRWPLAREIAKSLYENAPLEKQRLTAYCSVLRRTNATPEALAILKSTGDRFKDHRDVLYEWSVCAGVYGDYGLDAWLGGRSLADGSMSLDPQRCKLSLAGLGAAFHALYDEYQAPAYAMARRACGHLGLMLPDLDGTARRYFNKYVTSYPEMRGQKLSLEQAGQAIRDAVILGAYEVDPDNDPPFFEKNYGDPEGYRYKKLLGILEKTQKKK